MPDAPLLSIIIPAHNEERRLPASLLKIAKWLTEHPYSTEVIVVENGSSDRTAEVVREFAQDHPYVKLIQATTRGKGLAVRAGMLAARGDYRFICDADLSMPIDELEKFLAPELRRVDIVIGSREAPGSARIGEPIRRHLIGRVANWIIQLLAVRGFSDTQCGFKMFRGPIADDLFHAQRMNGIGFDVELLYVALKRGYTVRELPIIWYYDADSRMRLVQDSLKLFVEVLEIRQNWQRGIYHPGPVPSETFQHIGP